MASRSCASLIRDDDTYQEHEECGAGVEAEHEVAAIDADRVRGPEFLD